VATGLHMCAARDYYTVTPFTCSAYLLPRARPGRFIPVTHHRPISKRNSEVSDEQASQAPPARRRAHGPVVNATSPAGLLREAQPGFDPCAGAPRLPDGRDARVRAPQARSAGPLPRPNRPDRTVSTRLPKIPRRPAPMSMSNVSNDGQLHAGRFSTNELSPRQHPRASLPRNPNRT